MRIIAGRHRGRRLEAPPGRGIRPTADRIRQAIFDMLAHGTFVDRAPLEGARVLDACCGTGAMGLEALSRGATHCTFMDVADAALTVVRRNAALLGETERVDLRRMDAGRPARAVLPCALVFLDPPYRSGLAGPILEGLTAKGWIGRGAVVVLETARGEEVALPPGLSAAEERTYGDTTVRLLVQSEPADAVTGPAADGAGRKDIHPA